MNYRSVVLYDEPQELVFSFDIETKGDIPHRSDMLSFGVVAVNPRIPDKDKRVVGTFYRNLKPNSYGLNAQTEGNLEFWAKYPEAFAQTQDNQVDCSDAMEDLVKWVNELCETHISLTGKGNYIPAKAAAMAYPAAWDFGWIYWYINWFLGPDASPFRHQAIDLRTMISMVLNIPYREAHISKVPTTWLTSLRAARHAQAAASGDRSQVATHNGLDDAMDQAEIYLALYDRWQVILGNASRLAAEAILETLPL